MADAGLADGHPFLVALQEVRVVVKRTGLAFLQEAAVAGIVLDRGQRMGFEVKDLQLEPGRGLEPVHHPGEFRAADQGAELPFLRFYLHDAVRPLKGWVDLQGNNAVTAENLFHPESSGPYSA